jgi:hypothetical protein
MQSERARRNAADLRGPRGYALGCLRVRHRILALDCREMMRQARGDDGTRTVRIDTMR